MSGIGGEQDLKRRLELLQANREALPVTERRELAVELRRAFAERRRSAAALSLTRHEYTGAGSRRRS